MIGAGEALDLYPTRRPPLLGRLADGIRARKHPEGVVTYIIDRNVNYTNVCVARCNFCAFYRPVGSGEGYVLGFEEIFRKIDETIALGGGQLLLQGGHNPDLPLEWYEDLFRAVKAALSRVPAARAVAAGSIHLSRLSQLPVPQVIERLIAAGLDSIPGGGAEILVDRVRKLLNCYGKATRRRVARRHAPRAPRRAAHDGDDDVRARSRRSRSGSSTCCGCATCRTRPAASPPSSPGATSRTHRARRRRGDRRRVPADARDRAHRARQLRQPAGVVGDAGRQGRPAQPRLRRQRHGQRDDRGERRPRRRRQLLHGRDRDRPQHRERRLRRRSAATCTTRSWAIRSSASARCRACWSWRWRARRRHQPTSRVRPRSAAIAARERRREEGASDRSVIVYRAAWVLPIAAPPLRDGWVARRATAASSACGGPAIRRRAGGRAAISGERRDPAGLVNAHTHLELSWMRGRVPPARRFDRLGARAAGAAAGGSRIRRAELEADRATRSARRGRRARRSSATSPTRWSRVRLLRDSELSARCSASCSGSALTDPRRRSSPDAQAAASTASPRSARLRRRAWCRTRRTRCRRRCSGDRAGSRRHGRSSVHLGESPEEIEFLRDGGGPMARAARGARRVESDRGRRPAAGRWSTSIGSAC